MSEPKIPQIDSSSEEVKTEKSFSEEDRKFVLDFVDMFAAIKGKPLKLFFNPDSEKHFITFNPERNEYEIFTDPFDKKIFWKTAVEHEISHLLFDTKIKTFRRYAKKILQNTPYELLDIGLASIKNIYNVFEDMRIESWFGKYKLGFRKRIMQTRKSLGLNPQIVNEINNPISALLASRFLRNDLVRISAFKEAEKYISDSEFLSPKGSIVLTKKFYDEIMLPFLKEQKEKQDQRKTNPNPNGSNKNPNPNGSNKNPLDNKEEDEDEDQKEKEDEDEDETQTENPQTNPSGDPSDDEDDEDETETENPQTNPSGDPNPNDDQSGKTENPNNETKEVNTLDELKKLLDELEQNSDHKDYDEKDSRLVKINLDEIEKELEKSKEEAKKDFKELKEKLLNLEKNPSETNKTFDELIKRYYEENDMSNDLIDNGFQINGSLANKMSRVFDQVRSKRKNVLDVHGSTINIKQYANAKFDSNTKVFKNETKEAGLTLYIIHDMSGSMSYTENVNGKKIMRCTQATNTIATMYKAVRKYPQIKIKVKGFTGYGNNSLSSINVNKLSQVGKLNNHTGGTTLDLALMQAEKELKKINGKKFVIVLTDGYPNVPKREIDGHAYFKHLVQKLFVKKQIGIFGILIGDEKVFMQKVFGKNFAVGNLQEAETQLVNVFQKTVRENLQ